MTLAADFAQNLKLQADIIRIVSEYVQLKKSGAQNYSGLCPFHKEKTPSFSVHATKQFYYCFGCGEKGDVFKFVQKIENISFPEAVRAVAQKVGVAMPKQAFGSEAEAKDARLRTALLEIHDRAYAFFQECLRRPEGARAREYLTGRGLDDETIKKFRIGFAPDSGFLLRDRLKGQFSDEILRESGLFSWKESAAGPNTRSLDSTRQPASGSSGSARDDRAVIDAVANDERRTTNASTMYSKFRNRVTFPIANESGRVIAFTGRTLSADEKAGPKYLNSPET